MFELPRDSKSAHPNFTPQVARLLIGLSVARTRCSLLIFGCLERFKTWQSQGSAQVRTLRG